ncbi:MAG: BMP family ABC transporter substrate-binding protein [Lachnospiraceae bacterium]|nr:BMP family ABC transporter substrate-binding protein [Lachnospiraceae bacterium]
MQTDYNNAKKLGDNALRKSRLTGTYPYLMSLDSMVSQTDIAAEIDLGLREIPLSLIVGTKTAGRQNAFANNFMPILAASSEFGLKWSNLYDSQVEEGLRDPIKAYEYMNQFYVEEGNKRVSVMKYLGAYAIHANVIRVLPKKTDVKENKIYYEFLDFFNVTGIFGFNFSQEGCYARLASLLGQDLVNPWPDDLILDFKDAYGKFAEVFRAKNKNPELWAEDAFLVYLSVFSFHTISEISKEALGQQMDRLWNEFLTDSGEEKITLIDDPKMIDKMAGEPRADRLSRLLHRSPVYTSEKPLKIAFLYEQNEETSSWAYGNELGRNKLKDIFGDIIDTIKIENCLTDEDVERGIEAAVADEDEVIFTTSSSMMSETLKAAIRYPKIRFLNCSVNLPVNAVRTYYARTYESKFLMGAIAAALSPDHRIGYCAGYPIYGTIADINAFAIGAAMVSPESRVYLKWSSMENTDWEKELIDDGIVIIQGPEYIRPTDEAHRFGLYRIEEDGTRSTIAAPMTDWGRYFALIVENILSGSFDAKSLTRKDRSLNYWYGMSAGVLDIITSSKLPYYSRKTLALLKAGVSTGRINPFDGELHSQDGIVREEGSDPLTYEEIITMNWLNDNVIGSIPTSDEVSDIAKKTVSVIGVEASDKN